MGSNVSNRVGRPNAGDFSDPETGEINDQGMKLIQTAAGMGLPYIEIAALLGMSERTFFDQREKFPEINEVIKEGEAAAGFKVANSLLRRCDAGDMAAIRWFEMTRKGRGERIEQEVTETQYVVEVPAQQSQEAWSKQFSPDGGSDDSGSPTI